MTTPNSLACERSQVSAALHFAGSSSGALFHLPRERPLDSSAAVSIKFHELSSLRNRTI
jgi:hypothetical protein